MIHKSKLKNSFVMYLDKNSAQRLGKVTKIVGNTLTVKNAYGEKHRINPKTTKIFGRLKKRKIRFKKAYEYLEGIEW